MALSMDQIIREMDGSSAERKAPFLWQKIRELKSTSQIISESLFYEVLICSARCVLGKLMHIGFVTERWSEYLSFFVQATTLFRVHNTTDILTICEDVFQKVLDYPERSRDLLSEYQLCISAQQRQQEKERSQSLNILIGCPTLESASSEVALVPPIALDEVRQYVKILPQRLTFPLQSGIVRMRLANPLPIPEAQFICSGYMCDTCRLCDIVVAYQAILYDDDDEGVCVRSTAHFKKQRGCVGFDMCIGCAVFFYREACLRLSRVLREFRTLRVSSVTNVHLHSLKCKGDVLNVRISLEPWGARPIAWIVEKNMDRPPPAWRSSLRVTSCNQYKPYGKDGTDCEDQCIVCLQPLANDGAPVLETTCKHWFHVECIQEVWRMLDDECPLCRQKDVFEGFRLLAGQLNMYEVEIDCSPETKQFVLALGALLTSDGEYENPTNIAACTSLVIQNPCIMSFESKDPHDQFCQRATIAAVR